MNNFIRLIHCQFEYFLEVKRIKNVSRTNCNSNFYVLDTILK